MTWVTLPIETDGEPLSRSEKAVMKLADGDTCRVRTKYDEEEVEATIDTSRGGCVFVDEDGETLDVVAVWAAPPGGPSGAGGKTELVAAKVYLSAEEHTEQKAIAKSAGVSWSTWARSKLRAK